jgi:ABC-type cobalamin/Fe3+-siderophores transport system ATPase subunit
MYLNQFRVKNYKSFADTEPIYLRQGFNLLVGQNDAGKTALLEALAFFPQGHKPHRTQKVPKGRPLPPKSELWVDVVMGGEEFRELLLSSANIFSFLLPNGIANDKQALKYLNSLFSREVHAYLQLTDDWIPRFTNALKASVDTTKILCATATVVEHQDFRISRIKEQTTDDLAGLIGSWLRRATYVFRAERLSLGESPLDAERELKPNAANLATALLHLSTSRHSSFQYFVYLVREVFPHITDVVAESKPSNANIAHIKIWTHDITLERDDLATLLSDSGTGIGQVLAILFVLVTAETPRIIVIDEPNSFLHPGAAKKLIGILKQHKQHQYIISTHSPDIIRATEAQNIIQVKRSEDESKIGILQGENLESLRLMLADLGVQLSDVFGADAVLWVEGPTEEKCVPKLIPFFDEQPPSGTSIVGLVNVGDVDRKSPKAHLIRQIYTRLSSANALLPPAIGFCLDREDKTQAEIDQLESETQGQVKFLPRRSYENYLIHPEALSRVLCETETFGISSIPPSKVQQWLVDNGGDSKFRAHAHWKGRIDDEEWLARVDAAGLLKQLFSNLSGAKEEYRKTAHSVRLTEIILEIDLEFLRGAISHFESMLTRHRKNQ